MAAGRGTGRAETKGSTGPTWLCGGRHFTRGHVEVSVTDGPTAVFYLSCRSETGRSFAGAWRRRYGHILDLFFPLQNICVFLGTFAAAFILLLSMLHK